jgi:hypothetical protein
MKSMPRLCRCGLCYFSISCCILFTGLLPAWGQFPGGFSKVHFDGTFVILGQHILDTSDIGVLLQETNPNFQNLSKSNEKDISWDSDGVRYTADSKRTDASPRKEEGRMPAAVEVTQEPDFGPRPVREHGSLLVLALLAFAVGGISGLIGAVFRLVLERSDRYRGAVIDWAHGKEIAGLALVIGISAIATGLAAWLVRKFAPGAKGRRIVCAHAGPWGSKRSLLPLVSLPG